MLPLVTPKIRGADEIEYFSYLPSLVFDHDLDFEDDRPVDLSLFDG